MATQGFQGWARRTDAAVSPSQYVTDDFPDLTADIHAVTHRTKLCTTWTRRRQRRHRRARSTTGSCGSREVETGGAADGQRGRSRRRRKWGSGSMTTLATATITGHEA